MFLKLMHRFIPTRQNTCKFKKEKKIKQKQRENKKGIDKHIIFSLKILDFNN